MPLYICKVVKLRGLVEDMKLLQLGPDVRPVNSSEYVLLRGFIQPYPCLVCQCLIT